MTYIPYLKTTEELKSKSTQHSVKELRSIGIQPDIIICRSEKKLTEGIKKKISLLCDIEEDTIEAIDARHLYDVPMMLKKEKLDSRVLAKLELKERASDLRGWREMIETIHNLRRKVDIGIVGKYTNLKDAYISIAESLNHGGYYFKRNVNVTWIDSESIEKEDINSSVLSNVDGILVPCGFGIRGINGKISAIRYAREKKIPFLGICPGMQCAVIEFARNVMGLKDADITEFEPGTKEPVIDLMCEQKKVKNKGGTMRLGRYKCRLKVGSKAQTAYGEGVVYERHRHRYEFNNNYRKAVEEAGLLVTGVNPERNLVEIVEISGHPWFVAVQFHPEFKSRPDRPHPLFRDFIGASVKNSKKAGRN